MAKQADNDWFGLISTAVEKLGVDPCILAIVITVIGAFWVVSRGYKHQENMERIRIRQFMKAIGKEGDDDGTN